MTFKIELPPYVYYIDICQLFIYIFIQDFDFIYLTSGRSLPMNMTS